MPEPIVAEPLIATGPVLLELDGAVARLRLNRPEASNALDVPLLKALYEAGALTAHTDEMVATAVQGGAKVDEANDLTVAG